MDHKSARTTGRLSEEQGELVPLSTVKRLLQFSVALRYTHRRYTPIYRTYLHIKRVLQITCQEMPLWKKKKKKKRFTNPSFDVQATHSCSNVIRLDWKRKKDLLKCLFFFFLKVHFNERRKSIRVRVRVGLNNYLTLPRQADKYDDMWWRKAHSIRDNGKNDFLEIV